MRILLRSSWLPLIAGFLLVGSVGQSQSFAGSIEFLVQSPSAVEVGSPFTVDIYLTESGDAPFILNTDGIFAAAFKVTYTNATFSTVATNAGFDIANITSTTTGEVDFDLSAFLNPNVTSDAATPNLLWLGSVTLIAGSPDWISIGVSILTPGTDNVVTGDGTVLDDGLGSPALRIASVPEPGSLLMLSIGAAGLGLLRWRRRAA